MSRALPDDALAVFGRVGRHGLFSRRAKLPDDVLTVVCAVKSRSAIDLLAIIFRYVGACIDGGLLKPGAYECPVCGGSGVDPDVPLETIDCEVCVAKGILVFRARPILRKDRRTR